MEDLQPDEHMYMNRCISDLRIWVQSRVETPLRLTLKVLVPPRVVAFLKLLQSVEDHLINPAVPIPGLEEAHRIWRAAIIHRRKAYALENEKLSRITSDEGTLAELSARLTKTESLMSRDWFLAGQPERLPKLSDFLNIEQIAMIEEEFHPKVAAEYDEKFGILFAPSLFLPQLSNARYEASLRGNDSSIAFVDIDGFKSVNSKHGEDLVDREILPYFMRCMEAHIYSHGYAYRFGGDEYMILLPNADQSFAEAFLEQLRAKIEKLRFRLSAVLTVSIGLCSFGPESPLTDQELQHRATQAKAKAKDDGKNRIASFRGDSLG